MQTPPTMVVARHAMATRFEIALHGDHAPSLRAAAEEALDEIERLEEQLSLYRPTSEISRLNAHAHDRPVRVEPSVFRLLVRARELYEATSGAFDPTVGPLVRCWGFMGGQGRWPAPEELAEARSRVGMHLIEFDEATFSVRFRRPGITLDLGAIGKGYAVEQAAKLLVELGVDNALIHGGTSTICGLGAPPGESGWKVSIEASEIHAASASAPPNATAMPRSLVAVVELNNAALSVSAVWGRAFEHHGQTYGHVIDPRTGVPVQAAYLAAVMLPSATDTDARSTALLVQGSTGLDLLHRDHPPARSLVIEPGPNAQPILAKARGIRLMPTWEQGSSPWPSSQRDRQIQSR